MGKSGNIRILFSETLSTGIVVRFEDNVSVFFPAEFLFKQREAESNTVFTEDEDAERPSVLQADDWSKSADRTCS